MFASNLKAHLLLVHGTGDDNVHFQHSERLFDELVMHGGPRVPRASLALILHHDDEKREVAYDRESHVGRLVRGLDEGPKRGWMIVSMKDDWKSVFAPQ